VLAIARSLKPRGRFTLSERSGRENPRNGCGSEGISKNILDHRADAISDDVSTQVQAALETWKTVFEQSPAQEEPRPSQIDVEGFCSPFEDASGPEILAAVRRYFDIEKIESYGGFTEEILRSLYLPGLAYTTCSFWDGSIISSLGPAFSKGNHDGLRAQEGVEWLTMCRMKQRR